MNGNLAANVYSSERTKSHLDSGDTRGPHMSNAAYGPVSGNIARRSIGTFSFCPGLRVFDFRLWTSFRSALLSATELRLLRLRRLPNRFKICSLCLLKRTAQLLLHRRAQFPLYCVSLPVSRPVVDAVGEVICTLLGVSWTTRR